MSLFPRFAQEISPIFKVLDEYDRASRAGWPQGTLSNFQSFQPKFDVAEHKDRYELHGELPGIDQKDVNIEWSDGNTLTIHGRTEQRFEKGEPPKGFIEGEKENGHEYHKPTVEDEASGSKDQTTAVTTTEGNKDVQKTSETPKYWVTERSVGEFHRTFSFPTRVDQDSVKASLKNGVLNIVVPKAQKPAPRKITIE